MIYELETWFQLLNWQYTTEEYFSALSFFSDERKLVRDQFDKLSWTEDKETQEAAVNYLTVHLLPSEYIHLVFADKFYIHSCDNQIRVYRNSTGKEMWENAAKTVIKLGWPRVDNIILPLFMWLLDSNWPGSTLIQSFIKSLPTNVLVMSMKKILDNPTCYNVCEYNQLKDIINDICDEMQLDLK